MPTKYVSLLDRLEAAQAKIAALEALLEMTQAERDELLGLLLHHHDFGYIRRAANTRDMTCEICDDNPTMRIVLSRVGE